MKDSWEQIERSTENLLLAIFFVKTSFLPAFSLWQKHSELGDALGKDIGHRPGPEKVFDDIHGNQILH